MRPYLAGVVSRASPPVFLERTTNVDAGSTPSNWQPFPAESIQIGDNVVLCRDLARIHKRCVLEE